MIIPSMQALPGTPVGGLFSPRLPSAIGGSTPYGGKTKGHVNDLELGAPLGRDLRFACLWLLPSADAELHVVLASCLRPQMHGTVPHSIGTKVSGISTQVAAGIQTLRKSGKMRPTRFH